jgi:hypothetical protein
MQELQRKLGSVAYQKAGRLRQANAVLVEDGGRLDQSHISEGGFRQNILDRLGNSHLEDSQGEETNQYNAGMVQRGKNPVKNFASDEEYSGFDQQH